MNNLCYSTFMHLIRANWKYDIEQENLARGLLEAITSPNFHDKFSSAYLSYIWTRKRDVSQALAAETEKPTNARKCESYFRDADANELSPHLREDFYDKLKRLIIDDETISPAKKQSLLKAADSGNYGKYLSSVFLYAIKKPNKVATEDISSTDYELLQEVRRKCPLCNTKLVLNADGKTLYQFSVTKIFPEVDKKSETQFSKMHPKPVDVESKQNKICLCDSCATDYLFSPTVQVYDKLYRHKKKIRMRNRLEADMDKYPIEEQIVEILNKLKGADTDSDSFQIFRMKPLPLKEKILPENRILKQSILDDNNRYFYFIRDHLSQLDDMDHPFKKIALEIRTFYLTLTETMSDQEEIFNGVVDWILNSHGLHSSYRAAAHIVVSYFVQSCEVFDEIPQ